VAGEERDLLVELPAAVTAPDAPHLDFDVELDAAFVMLPSVLHFPEEANFMPPSY
jgi:hypothetical protein